ncbi:hypothetical protein DPEC_G00251040 [Dallia pectoralis]|uniref:Uncharacterized protein n=1 Tax=Dallia pectoralis TaxID=75939 RepID=A0ACC2FTA2_DALPE|nr:hypothetical protein DPEC_G00251040 [Dallia pectoralis]
MCWRKVSSFSDHFSQVTLVDPLNFSNHRGGFARGYKGTSGCKPGSIRSLNRLPVGYSRC